MGIPLYGQNKAGGELDALIDNKYVYKFEEAPMVEDAERLGGAAKLSDGSTEEEVSVQFPDGLNLSCAYMGACTVDAPTGTSLGMTWEQADTNNLGYQFVTSHKSFKGVEGKNIFTIGKAAFYLKHTFKIGNVSGLDYCMFGFRLKSQAHIADPKATYTDYACLDVNVGNIYAETALNNTTATPTDTTDNWGDGEIHELSVYVSKAGVASFKIDGQDPTVNTHSVTFDAADVVTVFGAFMKGAAEEADVEHIELEVGLQ